MIPKIALYTYTQNMGTTTRSRNRTVCLQDWQPLRCGTQCLLFVIGFFDYYLRVEIFHLIHIYYYVSIKFQKSEKILLFSFSKLLFQSALTYFLTSLISLFGNLLLSTGWLLIIKVIFRSYINTSQLQLKLHLFVF